MIPIYNGASYLRESISSVLEQDLGEDVMQVEVVDDCSTDADVKNIVSECGGRRVAYFRQFQNVGSLRNFETCINRARGTFVHILHCDDKVKAGFYTSVLNLFASFPEAAAAFCRHEIINSKGDVVHVTVKESEQPGILDNALMILAERQVIQYVSIVVRRETYEKLGGFFGVTYGEDWEMWARIAHKFPIAYTPEILAQYRRHEGTISTQSFLSGKNFRDMTKVLSTIQGYLPEQNKLTSLRHAQNIYAFYSLQFVETEYLKKQIQSIPFKFFFEATRFCNEFAVKWYVLKLMIKLPIMRVRRIMNAN